MNLLHSLFTMIASKVLTDYFTPSTGGSLPGGISSNEPVFIVQVCHDCVIMEMRHSFHDVVTVKDMPTLLTGTVSEAEGFCLIMS